MDGDIFLTLLLPVAAAVAAVAVVLAVRRSRAARAAALDGMARRRGWRVDDRPSSGGHAATLTISDPGGGWSLSATYPNVRSGGGRSQGWLEFRAPRPALAQGALVMAPPVPGADGPGAAEALRMLGGLASQAVLRMLFGPDPGFDAGAMQAVAGDHRGMVVLAEDDTQPLPDSVALAALVRDWPAPAGLVLSRSGLRLRQALPRAEAELEDLADRFAQLAEAVARLVR